MKEKPKAEKVARVIIHDLGPEFDPILESQCDLLIPADGRYAPCRGCFGCWTKHPAECFIKDRLHKVCQNMGRAEKLLIITRNCYGGYSPAVKNILDRSIGTSTPLSTFRGGQMHHTLRYKGDKRLKVIVYGDINDKERGDFSLIVERNAVNWGYAHWEVVFEEQITAKEVSAL